jgi:hypothetical protein
MRASSLKAICAALEQRQVRFIVAGGLAVNAHGYLRFTKDADLVIELVPDNIERAFEAFAVLGYRPNVPIRAQDFANAELRTSWIREKNMRVLQFWSDAHRETPIDVFVDVPFDFQTEWAASLKKELGGVGAVRFLSYMTLVRIKREAGREQDMNDIRELESARKQGGVL